LATGPNWKYELVEIPKILLLTAAQGELEMKLASRQFPKPGYCHVPQKTGKKKFQLYFDGGGERKLQVKNLLKEFCVVHAVWAFVISD
jgi:type II restriction enzyme